MSEFTKLGGYLIQGQPEVVHDSALSGNGLESSPLGLSEQVSEANDLVHSNSGTWDGVSAKLDTTATANFYTTANESGFISEVPAGTMNESAFGYDSDNKISSYNGSAIGGSAPTYSYTDNDLISAIDTSGLYATSALKAESANALINGGRLGSDVYAVTGVGTNSMTLMVLNPQTTPFGTTSGIYGPLYYAQGACMTYGSSAGSTQYFGGFFKGNEWYISNATAGQALRGETHASRGVHVSGATTAGYGFNLAIGAVSGVNSTGSWKYGPAEDAALRAVSSCDMHESAFGYDASDNITAYNGSAFKAGDEFPQSATEAIETVTANSADWNGTTETVSSNSGVWGGSALPISAGPGIKFEMVDNTLVASTDETVLWSGTPTSAISLSEPFSNFETIKITGYAQEQNLGMAQTFEFPGTNSAFDLHIYDYNSNGTSVTNYLTRYNVNGVNFSASVANYWWQSTGSVTGGTWAGRGSNPIILIKVIGINRIAGGN